MNLPPEPRNSIAEQFTFLERVILLNPKASWIQIAISTQSTVDDCRRAFRSSTRKILSSTYSIDQIKKAINNE